jgi:hypothetical protein
VECGEGKGQHSATVFLDPLALTFPDPYDSGGQEREIPIGYTARHRVAFVSHCQRGDGLRIISARKATRGERRQYEEGIGKEIQQQLPSSSSSAWRA